VGGAEVSFLCQILIDTRYVETNHHDWDKWLQQVVFACRTSVHSTIGVSPFEIIHGRKAMIPIDIQFHCEINETMIIMRIFNDN
jgi:hypothetical protein